MNKKRGNVPKTKGLITNDYLIIISIIVIAGIFFQTVKIFIIDNPNFPNNKANVIGLVTFEITKYPTNCINDAQDIIAWASPENACVSDDVYATASVKGSPLVKSDGLLVTGFHFAIPSGATINGIDVYAEVKVNVIGTAADYEIKLMKDGSTLIGDNLAIGDSYSTSDKIILHGDSSQLWGSNWTAEEINADGFGVSFSAKGTTSSSRIVSVDAISMKVRYTESVDITNPLWTIGSPMINETNIYTNQLINFTTNWTDNVALSCWIFSTNMTGTWINSTATTFATGLNISSNITYITAAAGTNFSWMFFANDSSNNWNGTPLQYTYVATTPNSPIVTSTNSSSLSTISTPVCKTMSIQANGNNSAIFVFVDCIDDLEDVSGAFLDNVTWGSSLLTRLTKQDLGRSSMFVYYATLGTQTSNTQNVSICFSSDFPAQIAYGVLSGITLSGVNQINSYIQYVTNTSTGTKAYMNVSGTNNSNLIIDNIINDLGSSSITRDSKQFPIYDSSSYGGGNSAGSWKNASSGTTKTNYTLSRSANWRIISVEVNGLIVPDTTKPISTDLRKNTTTVYQNQLVSFSVNLTDEIALSSYIFSQNSSGAWVNSSIIGISGTSANITNITYITAESNTNVSWQFWFNDASNNWNHTDIQSFIVSEITLTGGFGGSDGERFNLNTILNDTQNQTQIIGPENNIQSSNHNEIIIPKECENFTNNNATDFIIPKECENFTNENFTNKIVTNEITKKSNPINKFDSKNIVNYILVIGIILIFLVGLSFYLFKNSKKK